MDDQDSRTGYSWLELGHVSETSAEGNGSPAQRSLSDNWLRNEGGARVSPSNRGFSRRLCESMKDLDLKTPEGVPLTTRQLTEAIGNHGQVVERAQDYRRLLDESLFRLGERYEPLIDLLLQLRQPQLAKKLDLEQLEAALRGALPPLSESLLEDAAEAFRDLDQYREGLRAIGGRSKTCRNSLVRIVTMCGAGSCVLPNG